MPNKSASIVLAGHGAVSGKRKTIDDKFVGSYNIILPSKFGGLFCYAAHNMISQNLLSTKTAEELHAELLKLEKTHGVSSVSTNNPGTYSHPVYFTQNSSACYLSWKEDRQRLRDVLEKLEFSSLPGGLFDDPIVPDWGSLQSNYFLDVDFTQAEQREKIKNKIETELKKTKHLATDEVRAWQLLEHMLGCVVSEENISMEEVLAERMYTPQHPYEVFTILDEEFNLLGLKMYINKEKIIDQLKSTTYIDQLRTKLIITADQVFYIIPSYIPAYITDSKYKAPPTLSNILNILHNIHIFVATNAHSIDSPEIRYVCCSDISELESTNQWYDFTIPEDANVVWGACREINDSF